MARFLFEGGQVSLEVLAAAVFLMVFLAGVSFFSVQKAGELSSMGESRSQELECRAVSDAIFRVVSSKGSASAGFFISTDANILEGSVYLPLYSCRHLGGARASYLSPGGYEASLDGGEVVFSESE